MTFHIDPQLIGVDRLAKRWARSDATRPALHPIERARLLREGQVTAGHCTVVGLPADVAAFIDIHLDAPPDIKAVLTIWYCGPAPVYLKAKRIGCSRSTLYRRWAEALEFMLVELQRKGHSL